ncbi:transmembrane protein 254-like [Pollicipes pollicipes]|uniref:transmembrane protein 254-like n=1 Tax=Pollicipes pollicipes TaxID=41117 RepID=UPI001884EA28|nr:transmembrane protein 254-like [Pollicipes pollicipes]XP_037072848.1 transmembrane protein 254-like [Pollicipes pollicipes]
MAVASTYFRWVQPSSVILTALLFYVLTAVWLGPTLAPEAYLGPVARLLHAAHGHFSNNARQGLIATPVIHALECMVALHRCRRLGIRGATTAAWLLQTLLFGIGSLKFLLWPIDDSHQKRH